MLLSPLHALLLLAVPLLLGASLLRVLGLGWRSDRIAFAAWAYLAGSLATAGLTLAWWLAAKPIDGRLLLPIAAMLAAVIWFLTRRSETLVTAEPPAAPRWERALFWVLVCLLLLLCLDRAMTANSAAIVVGDEANIWAAKAKLLFHTHGPGAEAGPQARVFVLHPDYPLLNPLLQLWTFAGAGEITHVANRLPIQAFAPALLLALACALRQSVRPAVAAVLLLLVFSHSVASTYTGAAYADLMVAFGLLVACDAFLRWRQSRAPEYFRLCALALTFLIASKSEGVMLALVLALSVAVARAFGALGRPVLGRAQLCWLALPLAAIAGHQAFNVMLGLSSYWFDAAQSGSSFGQRLLHEGPGRISFVLGYFCNEVLLAAHASKLLLVMFGGLVVLHPSSLRRAAVAVPFSIVLGSLCGYAVMLLSTPLDLAEHLETAVARLAFHVTPVATLGLAAAVASLFGLAAKSTREPAKGV